MLKEIIAQKPGKPQPQIPGAIEAPTLAEAVAEQMKADATKFNITDVEQFCYDQRLTGPEAEAVEIICNHQSADDLDIAISKLQRVKQLAYASMIALLCFIGLPSCATLDAGNVESVGITYDAASKSWIINGAIKPTTRLIAPTK